MTSTHDIGLLALRAGLGGTLVAHGSQKLFGSFGGGGIDGTAAFFDSVGFKPGKANAILAGISEVGGGALLAVGLATPAAAGAVTGTMAVAGSMHASNGFFAQQGGFEYPAVLALAASSLALIGPGALSLDHALGHSMNRPWMRTVALAAVVPATVLVLNRRKKAVAAAAATAGPVDGAHDETGA
ncbi:MAG: DoxX family protein [Allobranchiibius sp.]